MDLWFTFPFFFSSSITLTVCYFTNHVVTLKFVIDELTKWKEILLYHFANLFILNYIYGSHLAYDGRSCD